MLHTLPQIRFLLSILFSIFTVFFFPQQHVLVHPEISFCPSSLTSIKAGTLVVLVGRIRTRLWQRTKEKSTGIKFQCNCLLNCGLQLLKFHPWFCVTTALMNSAWLWFSCGQHRGAARSASALRQVGESRSVGQSARIQTLIWQLSFVISWSVIFCWITRHTGSFGEIETS